MYKIEPNELENPAHQPPSPRYGHTIGAFNNNLYVFGGYAMDNQKCEYSNSLHSFNLGLVIILSFSLNSFSRFTALFDFICFILTVFSSLFLKSLRNEDLEPN